MHSRIFLIFCACFALGVFFSSFADLSLFFGLFWIFLSLVFAGFSISPVFIHRKIIIFLSISLFAFGSGCFWFSFKAVSSSEIKTLENKIEEKIVLVLTVSEEPEERENHTNIVFETKEGVKIFTSANRYPALKYGDSAEVKGVLKSPEKFSSDFDWPAYLSKDEIYFQMFYPEIKLTSSGDSLSLKGGLYAIKEKFISSINRIIPEPESALLGGLTVGAKRSLPESLLEDFKKTGVAHIVVLSGYNITIVADAIIKLFNFLPSAFGIGFGFLSIVLFTLMTGASATAVRASIMAGVALLARSTGRVYEATMALVFAGFLMIICNPKILRFDASFQLSFLATLSLIYLAPVLEKRFLFFPKKFGIRTLASSTLSAQIFVLPLLLYKTGIFSAVSLPVNLLILPFIPATMLFGFLAGVADFIFAPFSLPFGWIAHGFLAYELKVVEFFAGLPLSSFSLPNFPLWLMWFSYFILIILIFISQKQNDASIQK
ncbi:MAG: ComEC/Rec2 family competence protein [Candidatus Pacebacteria bacterium]|nr:ComEC/Rec2 family competence protein [Candidatus Paceibacterota bacterium]